MLNLVSNYSIAHHVCQEAVLKNDDVVVVKCQVMNFLHVPHKMFTRKPS